MSSTSGFLLALTLLGCSGAVANAVPKPGPMPENAHWDGLYQGPYHIQLRIVTEGNHASGQWRAIGGREGEFSGTVSGNLLVVDWTERGLKNAESWSGRGYFVYQIGKGGGAHEISGEWGLGERGTSNSWWAIKRPAAGLSAQLVDNDAADDDQDDSQACLGGCDAEDMDQQE